MTLDYAAKPRRHPPPIKQIAAGVLVLLCVAIAAGFSWLHFDAAQEQRWIATHPNPPGASAWRTVGDAKIRDVSVTTPFYVTSLQQVYDPTYDDATSRPPRNKRIEYRPALWAVCASIALMLVADLAVLLVRRNACQRT